MSEADFSAEQYIRTLEGTNGISESAIRQAIEELGIGAGCGLDIPCGIGSHAIWMAERYPQLEVECADFSPEHVEYARKCAERKGLCSRLSFNTADMNNLEYADNSFDFVWCCDGLWPGPVGIGCIAEEPYDILKDLKRIVRPGGTIAVLFWSSHRILPGYPILEGALNSVPAANIPMTEDKPPALHFMSARSWLTGTGLVDVRSCTFASDINGPLNEAELETMQTFAEMFWGAAESQVSPEVWKKFKEITDPDSDCYVFGDPSYAGLITYTMFTGTVPE